MKAAIAQALRFMGMPQMPRTAALPQGDADAHHDEPSP
jgi:hypothetical protein